MKLILLTVLVLGFIALTPVFALPYPGLVNTGTKQFSLDTALIIIFSDSNWSIEFGPAGSKITDTQSGNWYYSFSCKENELYNIKFTKESQGGNEFILNVIQNGTLLNNGKIDSGTLTMSGKCFTRQVTSDDNGFIKIFDNLKNSYSYNDTIALKVDSKFTDYFNKLKFEINDPYNKKIPLDLDPVSFREGKHTITKDIEIKDHWGPTGNYTIYVSFDDYNKVFKKINILQKGEDYTFTVTSQYPKQEIKNNSILVVPKRDLVTELSGHIENAQSGDLINFITLQQSVDKTTVIFDESVRTYLNSDEDYELPHPFSKFVEGCYEIQAKYNGKNVGHIQFFVTAKTVSESDSSKFCKDVLPSILEFKENHITLEQLESILKGAGWTGDQINSLCNYGICIGKGTPPINPDIWSGIAALVIIGAGIAFSIGGFAYRSKVAKQHLKNKISN